MRCLIPILLCAALNAGCSTDAPPVVFPIEPATVDVNATLVLSLAVLNPDGTPLTWSFAGPPLPSLADTSSLSGTPTGAEFRWTPLASHVGVHQFDFTATSEAGSSTQSVVLTVAPQAGAAPVFIQPAKGGTYDVDVSPCVNFDLEVKDDDTPEVAIRANGPMPDTATVETVGKQRARFRWCPSD
ncbi:MAG: hypothetical protein ACI9WU_002245, partial [Myxococcota bacterium]